MINTTDIIQLNEGYKCTVSLKLISSPIEEMIITFSFVSYSISETNDYQEIIAINSYDFTNWNSFVIQTEFVHYCKSSKTLCNRLFFNYIIDKKFFMNIFQFNFSEIFLERFRQFIRLYPDNEELSSPLTCSRSRTTEKCIGGILTRCQLDWKSSNEYRWENGKLRLEVRAQLRSSSSQPIMQRFTKFLTISYQCNRSNCDDRLNQLFLRNIIASEHPFNTLFWPNDYIFDSSDKTSSAIQIFARFTLKTWQLIILNLLYSNSYQY
ncbi:hypothetical protein I4U23_027254 [Adineta vaga]|nr:hypothetical protein I4U23_027254 [Adineta vaga]